MKPAKDDEQAQPLEELDHSRATPEEVLDNAYQKIRKALAQDVLSRITASHPGFFERLVVELLVKMGYGGSIQDAGKATRFTNDEGIDGEESANSMVDYGLGVSTFASYDLKRIDNDYFGEQE